MDYSYVEVMACPGGCTNGGGQIKVDDPIIIERKALPPKPGPQEQKDWLSEVDEAYFSGEETEVAGDAVRAWAANVSTVELHPYLAVAERLECDTKTVDNALQRVKRKVGSHLDSRAFVADRMRGAGLEVHVDGGGNIVGRLPGSASRHGKTLKPIMTGSHTDTVKNGGRFDGIVGVLGAIEAVHLLRGRGIDLDHDLYVVDVDKKDHIRKLKDLLDEADQLVDGGALTGADVDGKTRCTLGGRSKQVRVDDVVDVGEVARLLSVAEHRGWRPGHCRPKEERDDGRVRRGGALARPEDVEVAERDPFDEARACIGEDVLLRR
jgi:hypothetical protein